jgi:hypothetical protein
MDRPSYRETTRRRLLAALATGVAGTLAGCSATGEGGDGSDTPTPTATPTPGRSTAVPERGSLTTDRTPIPVEERDSLAEWGFPSTICQAEIIDDFGIRAVVEPAFADDWAGLDVDERYRMGFQGKGLADGSHVIGLTSADGARARAYPLAVVWWHEVVNDSFGGESGADEPVLVTFCPICQSGMVAERLVGGVETTFGVSGQLWQPPDVYAASAETDGRVFGASATDGEAEVRNSGNLVLYDERTRSYWSQLLAEAICGERQGERLGIVPSTVTTWGEWRADHPETDVLLPPPHSTLM